MSKARAPTNPFTAKISATGLSASSAFVAGWLPGSEGLGVAEVLFGHYGFRGRLPLPWPAGEDAGEGEQFPRGYGLEAGPGPGRA